MINHSKFQIQNSKFLVIFLFSIFYFLLSTFTAQAATLYFSPSSGSHAVGTSFTVSVYVSSADQAMNAASGVISFPTDKLEVISLSKTGSIFNLWVQEPSFSNSGGTVNFEGIVLNPGFTGASGKVIDITFRVKAAGGALLTFSSGSVLANDGQGTNILSNLGNASFALESSGQAPRGEEQLRLGTPEAPKVSSPTHPNSDKWYAKKDAVFTWEVPAGITAVQILVSQVEKMLPRVTYAPPIGEKKIADLQDGVWYFHIRFKNVKGWGETAHFRFQIDTTPPQPISIRFLDGQETDNPRPTVLFDTVDTLSGIDYYQLKIGEGDNFILSAETVKNNPYTLPYQAPGKRTLIVRAFDKAGNSTAASADFLIKPPPSPIITTGIKITNVLAVIIPLVALILMLAAMLWFAWHKLLLLRKRLWKESREAESALHRAFDLLKEDVREQIKMLEGARGKRQLTEEEEKIIKQLQKDLDDAERFIKKEIEDIEREME